MLQQKGVQYLFYPRTPVTGGGCSTFHISAVMLRQKGVQYLFDSVVMLRQDVHVSAWGYNILYIRSHATAERKGYSTFPVSGVMPRQMGAQYRYTFRVFLSWGALYLHPKPLV